MERPFQEIGRNTAMVAISRAFTLENGMTVTLIGPCTTAPTSYVIPGSSPLGEVLRVVRLISSIIA